MVIIVISIMKKVMVMIKISDDNDKIAMFMI